MMKHFLAALLSIILAILIGSLNYLITEKQDRKYIVWLHIASPLTGFILLWISNSIIYQSFKYGLFFCLPWGFLYWIYYDFTLGYLLTGKIFHIGTTGIDKYSRKIFPNGAHYAFFKAIWGLVLWGTINHYYTL